jgi:hypothetical protein
MNIRKNVLLLAALGCALFSAAPAFGSLISVPNFSFQNADVADGGTSISVPNWNFVFSGAATGGVEDPLDAAYPGTTGDNTPLVGPGSMDGGQSAFITLPDSAALATGYFVSAASLATVANSTTYTLTVAVGDRADSVDPFNVLIELLVNGNPVASATTTGALLPDGTFTDLTTSFTTSASDVRAGGALTVRLTHSKTAVDPDTLPQVSFDNVRLDGVSAVPEPATVALLCCGGLGLLMARRAIRRRRIA